MILPRKVRLAILRLATYSDANYSRMTFALFSGCAALVCLIILFFYWLFSERDYAVSLTFWFLFFLATFHSYFALDVDLTSRFVKAIDYWYLGIAAVGVLVFAIGHSDQRSEYWVFLDKQDKARLTMESRTDLKKAVEAYISVSCGVSGILELKHCAKGRELARVFNDDDPTNVQISRVNSDFKQFVSDTYTEQESFWDTADPIRNRVYLLRAALKRYYFNLERYTRIASLLSERKETSFRQVWFGEAFLWPFLLSLALALRITKVTIEIEKWERD